MWTWTRCWPILSPSTFFRYNRDHSEALTKADLEGRWLWEIVSVDRHDRREGYLRSEDFFEDLPVMEDSQRVVRELTREYEVYIATAAMEFPNSFGPKYRWLRRHFPFLYPAHFVFCGDKGILNADFLIDDQPTHFRAFAGEGIIHCSAQSWYLRFSTCRQLAASGQHIFAKLQVRLEKPSWNDGLAIGQITQDDTHVIMKASGTVIVKQIPRIS